NQDILTYDLEAGALGTLPYVNTSANERQPYFSSDGATLLFVSNRGGKDHVYMVDLVTHFVDPLPLLNSADGNERSPRFLGLGHDRIVFETDRGGVNRVMIYDRATGLVDTLPIANQVGSEALLSPVVPSPSPSVSPSPSPSPSASPSPATSPTPTPTPSATPTP
ncbi:MAG: hypothetical protein JWM80_2419, partial [Cyanobacteria bacterium RYN_339]|nr:hypothetical protein [Cyanobacteria bacterium RYN_339]